MPSEAESEERERLMARDVARGRRGNGAMRGTKRDEGDGSRSSGESSTSGRASREIARAIAGVAVIACAITFARTMVGRDASGRQGGRTRVALGAASGRSASGRPRVFGYDIVRTTAHDPDAFTQGLTFCGDGMLCESTGATRGKSTVRVTEAASGELLAREEIDDVFAEGLARSGSDVHVISWKSNRGFSYEVGAEGTLRKTGTFTTPLSDGWGAAELGGELYVTDGSDKLHVLTLPRKDGDVLELKRSMTITDGDRPVRFANELETVGGELYANILERPCLARIDPSTGVVTAWINLKGLKESQPNNGRGDVMNGIAYDEANDALHVTGKLWPATFEVKLLESAVDSAENLRATRAICWPPSSLPQYGYP